VQIERRIEINSTKLIYTLLILDRSTLILFMKTQEETLGFREYFPYEKVTVHLDNTKIYFTTESGFTKDIGTITVLHFK